MYLKNYKLFDNEYSRHERESRDKSHLYYSLRMFFLVCFIFKDHERYFGIILKEIRH